MWLYYELPEIMTQLTRLNPIKTLALNGDYADGFGLYKQLTVSSPEDDRWAGVCLWGLGQLQDARITLIRAIRRNETSAAIEAASVSRLLGELDECEQYLDLAFDADLSRDDYARVLRERGELHHTRQEYLLAKSAFNDAWVEASLCANNQSLISSIGQALGWINHKLGFDAEAEKYFSKAFEGANPIRQTFIQLTRAILSTLNADYESAKKFLDHEKIENNYLTALKLPIVGLLQLSVGDFQSAYNYFTEGVNLAMEYGFIDIQCDAQVGLCKSLIGGKHYDSARGALKRAEHLQANPENKAARDLTAGIYWTEVGVFDKAFTYLNQALEYYQIHDSARELGWTYLHLAAWHYKCGNSQAAIEFLEQVADIAGALDNTAFLIPELRLISDLEGLAKIATPYGLNVLKPVLETKFEHSMPLEHRPEVKGFHLQAFGQAVLLANGNPVHLNSTARTIEVLAYLMLHPMSTREKILTDVFEESDPKAANNYFHQIKHQLVLNSNGLQINYDRITRTYSLEAPNALMTWDYSEIMRLLSVPVDTDLNQALDLYAGAFLRHSSAEWVEEVRSNVEWLLVRTGLKVVQDLFERGDFDACRKMTERLRKVEPLDESLNELLVRATTELDGALAGRRTVAEVERTFGGYGEALPPTLKRLREELKLTLN
jgi:two-component SAPR family response regulator/Tfp pilus assembly protein PilF